MALPPELRQLIYDYYLSDRKLPNPRKPKTHINPFDRIEIKTTKILEGYFGILHHSSGVRAENVVAIYRAWFTGVWLLCDVDEHATDPQQRHGELKRVKEMCSLIREIDGGILFGLHFVVSDYSRSVFLRFVDSFFGLQDEGGEYLKPEYVCSARHWGEQMMTPSTSDICYTYWTTTRGDHELWMFGTLAKLDWSKFSFEFAAPEVERTFHWELSREGSVESDGEDGFCRTDEEENGATSDSEDEIRGLGFDSENDEDEQDHDEGTFAAEEESGYPDAGDEGSLLDSEYESQHIDDEDVLDDEEEDELWSDSEY